MSNDKTKTERAEATRDERYARLTKADDNVTPNFLVAAWNGVKQAFDGLNHVRRGLETVGMHTWRTPTTEAYPDKAPELPPHFRGRLALTVNPDTGENLCISCRQCERVCPDKCIEITAHKSPETNKLELIDFKIDHGLCMFCGLCTEVCPTACIINTNDFEMADYSRGALIYDLKKLTLTQEESAYYFAAKEMPLPKPKPVKAAAPAAGAAPSAAAKPAVTSAPGATKPTTTTPPATAPAAKAAEINPLEPAKIDPVQEPKIEPKPEPRIEPVKTPEIQPVPEPKIEPVSEPMIEPASEPKAEAKTENKSKAENPIAEKIETQDKPDETPTEN